MWGLTHGFYASTGGFSANILKNEEETEATLTAKGVIYFMKHDRDALRDISKKDIRDKSKHDSISKCLALVQVLWFGAQCIARLAQGLPVSLLELNTFVHTLYAFITYGLWWKKPFDVDVPHTIIIRDDAIRDTLLSGQHPANVSSRYLVTNGVSKPLLIRLSWRHLLYGTSPFHVDKTHPVSSHTSIMVASSFGALYGVLHLAAWNSSFPTPLEGFLWRISALCIVMCGAIVSISQALVIRLGKAETCSTLTRMSGILLPLLNFATSYSMLF